MNACRNAILAILLLGVLQVHAEGWLDMEGGYVGTTYNEIQIPRDTGTRFSLVDDLDAESRAYWRLRASWSLGEGRRLEALAAPLSLEAAGEAPKDLVFEGVSFAAGSPLSALFRFDSYRISYLQEVRRSERLLLELGFTAKLRDAEITVESGDMISSKDNRGFVPLLALRMDWRFAGPWRLLLDLDALAAPQGRAEDLLVAFGREIRPGMDLRAGYRMVEGGADVEEVYNFALLHYASAGLRVRF